MNECRIRPEGLPDLTITRGAARAKSGGKRGGGGGGGGGGAAIGGGDGDWARGNDPPRRQSTQISGGGEWERGKPPPKQTNRNRGPTTGGRGGRGGGGPPIYDGPVAPLVRSENHWRPKKSTSALDIAEKQVKSILNKMTKEKFDRLSQQMIEIPILSYEMLSMIIKEVYEKAIDEPNFGDMYADLCVKLSQSVQGSEFVRIIESDEEPPTEAEPIEGTGASSTNTVYRWSNDVSTTDSEIIGPFPSEEACIEVALDEEEHEPVERGETALELVNVLIKQGTFIKVLKLKDPKGDEEDGIYYTVYFPVNEADQCGQQLSEIFLSEVECKSDAAKKNSFKRSLLNKCEEEFVKQDIYADWKKEKQDYEENKNGMSESERAEKEEDLEFRRIRIKKQMLGNVKFIGQLYKKGLLKERIMRFCIASLLKLVEREDVKGKNPEYKDSGDTEIDEEDHEAICSMFITIGSTIDKPPAADFMNLCFEKITALSDDIKLPSRSRFMYKDLLELRDSNWIPRRKVENAKTLDEIRRDVEREERRQAQLSAGRGGDRRNITSGGRQGDVRSSRQQSLSSSSKLRLMKPTPQETDDEGFTVIGAKANIPRNHSPQKLAQPKSEPIKTSQSFAALAEDNGAPAMVSAKTDSVDTLVKPLDDEKLIRRIKGIRTEFLANDDANELLLSMQELSATPNAVVKVITMSCDFIIDCKEEDRKKVLRMLITLAENDEFTPEEVKEALADIVEFIDSFVLDCPRVYEYIGEVIGQMMMFKMIDIPWFCEQCIRVKEADSATVAPEKLLRAVISTIRDAVGVESAKEYFGTSNEALILELLGEKTWSSIVADLF